jgi:hypothetical protein
MLSSKRQRNIRRAANDTIYQANRTNFITMNVDLMVWLTKSCNGLPYKLTLTIPQQKYIRDNHTSMGLSNIIGNHSREKILASVVKKTCSSVRNAFRQDVSKVYCVLHIHADNPLLPQIRDSIIGAGACTLAEFTFQSANKYRRGQFDEKMGLGYSIHNVILVSKIC